MKDCACILKENLGGLCRNLCEVGLAVVLIYWSSGEEGWVWRELGIVTCLFFIVLGSVDLVEL